MALALDPSNRVLKGWCISCMNLPKVFQKTGLSTKCRIGADVTECIVQSGITLFATQFLATQQVEKGL